VALEAAKGEGMVSELAAEYGVRPTMIHHWKRSLPEGAAGIIERGGKAILAAEIAERTVRDLHAKVGELAVFSDLLSQSLKPWSQVRCGMIERAHPTLLVGAQYRLLSISRSSFQCTPQGERAMNLDLMLWIDKQFLDAPFHGVPQMTWHLRTRAMS
jgi:transposase-like protein